MSIQTLSLSIVGLFIDFCWPTFLSSSFPDALCKGWREKARQQTWRRRLVSYFPSTDGPLIPFEGFKAVAFSAGCKRGGRNSLAINGNGVPKCTFMQLFKKLLFLAFFRHLKLDSTLPARNMDLFVGLAALQASNKCFWVRFSEIFRNFLASKTLQRWPNAPISRPRAAGPRSREWNASNILHFKFIAISFHKQQIYVM